MIFKYFIISSLVIVTIALPSPLSVTISTEDNNNSPISITLIVKRKIKEEIHETCNEGKTTLKEHVLNKLRSCSGSDNYGTDFTNKNPKCEGVCVMGALGQLDKEGLPNYEIHELWIKTEFPLSMQEMALSHFSECYKRHESTFDLTDGNCIGLNNFSKCIWSLQSIWPICIVNDYQTTV